ncbi:MAG: mannose-6-phosphate isomerase, partial [Bacteroidales bacterium]|nr:mannose-6-phosphate isomerase [Bacteroidales bacterium]
RELHLQEAMAAIDFELADSYKNHYTAKKNETVSLVKSDYFITNLLDLDMALAKDFTELDSFVIYLCTEGVFEVDDNIHDKVLVTAGETVLLPASATKIELKPLNKAKLLEVYILPPSEN